MTDKSQAQPIKRIRKRYDGRILKDFAALGHPIIFNFDGTVTVEPRRPDGAVVSLAPAGSKAAA